MPRLPVAVDIDTRDGLMEKDSLLQNSFVDLSNGRPIVTKRPGLFSEVVALSGFGQGLFVWSPSGYPELGAITGDGVTAGASFSNNPKSARFGVSPINWKIQTNYASPVTVEVVDYSSTVVSGYTGTVTLRITPETNTNNAALSNGSVAAVAGVATFTNLKVNKVGSYKLKATATGLKPKTSDRVNIRSRMEWILPPAPSYPGGPIDTITAKVVDSAGATITGFVGNLTLSLGNIDDLPLVEPLVDQPTLSGTRTVAAASGVATFSGLSIDKAGDWTFRLTDFPVNPGVSGFPDITYPWPPKWISYPDDYSDSSYGGLQYLETAEVETGWSFVFTVEP